MKRARFIEDQIVGALDEHEACEMAVASRGWPTARRERQRAMRGSRGTQEASPAPHSPEYPPHKIWRLGYFNTSPNLLFEPRTTTMDEVSAHLMPL